MAPFVGPTLAAVSALVAVASLLVYLHATRRSDQDSAREEAVALAEMRGELIAELRAALHMTRAAARDNLVALRSDLEQSPSDVDRALERIRRFLERDQPSPRAPTGSGPSAPARRSNSATIGSFRELRAFSPSRLPFTVRVKAMARISTKNQVTIPVAALEEAGLRAGDQVVVEALEEGELRIRRSEVSFERAFGALTGTYPRGYLEQLDREDAER